MEKVRDVLDAHGIKYSTELASISPEQLPVDELAAFSKAAVGDLFINPRGDGSVLLMSVAAIEEDVPMTLERARPLIEEYLQNTRNQSAAAEYVARVRANAQDRLYPVVRRLIRRRTWPSPRQRHSRRDRLPP